MPDERDDAATIVAHIDEIRASFHRRTQTNDRFIYLLLAMTYLFGFGGEYTIQRAFPTIGGRGVTVAIAGLVSLLIIFAHSFKQYRGVHGYAARRPAVFGVAWLIGLVLTALIGAAVGALMRPDDVEYVAYGTSCILMGAIYAFSGIYLYNSRKELILGLWLIAVGIVSMLLGMPLMLLIIGVLAAAGFLVCALATGPHGRQTTSESADAYE